MLNTCFLLAALQAFVPTVYGAPASSSSPSTTSAGTATSVSHAPIATNTQMPAGDDPNPLLWTPYSDESVLHQPVRENYGAPIMAAQNKDLQRQNADLLAPPSTDAGTVPSLKWPFSFSHNRLQTGGWARQQTVDDLPAAKQLAAVNMRLQSGAIRELHWHSTAEWAFVLKGSTQITSVDQQGQNYRATVNPGDLWYFPAGIPHSLQGTSDDPEGSEFLLVFDSGTFDESATFLLTDWLAHTPKDVIGRNFKTSQSAWKNIPSEELYIFPNKPPADDARAVESPQGTMPNPLSFAASKMNTTQLEGGTVKVIDSSIFKASKNIAMAEVTVEPEGLREMHWHPTEDEWGYVIEGECRITVFAAQSNARTWNFQAGDIWYIPASNGHYVENTSNSTLHYLEIFKTDRYEDVSLSQWLALTPPEIVQAHTHIDNDTLSQLAQFKTKATIVAPGS